MDSRPSQGPSDRMGYISLARLGIVDVTDALRTAELHVHVHDECTSTAFGAHASPASFRRRVLEKIPKEIHAGPQKGLVVIENKVGSVESDQQHSKYEEKARSGAARMEPQPFLVFLTPKDTKPASSKSELWACVSYIRLASCPRDVWRGKKKAVGSRWLRL